MHPDLERIMDKIKAEHPHVPVPEVETPQAQTQEALPEELSPAERLEKMFGDNLPEVLRDAAAHARQIESTHPDL